MQRFEDSIFDAISRQRTAIPEQQALSFEGVSLSWGELTDSVESLAKFLEATVPGTKIGLLLPNAPSLVLFFLAGVCVGKDVQFLDADWPSSTAQNVLHALQPDLLVTATTVQTTAATVLLNDAYQSIEKIVTDVVGSADSSGVALPPSDTALPFYTGFTSGSTGMPKGFQRDQISWLESFRGDQELFAFSEQDVLVAPGNLAHSLFLYAVIRGLYAGCHTIFFRSFRPDRVLSQVRDRRATVVYGVPTQYDAMVAASKGESFQTVRLILSSGAKLPDSLKEQLRSVFPRAEICEFFGTSEQSYVSAARDGEAPAGSVGKAFPGVRLRILDDEGKECRPGQIGRVFADSALTFIDYALAEQATLQRNGNAICVGDLGYVDEGGYLYLVGRADRMVLISGKNVYPEEIEATLLAHPAISNAAVFGSADERRGQRLIAVLKPGAPKTTTRRDLIAWCRDHLPVHKLPAKLFQTSDWPLTVSHKTDFPKLRQHLEAGALEPWT